MTSQRSTWSCRVTWGTQCTHTSCKFATHHVYILLQSGNVYHLEVVSVSRANGITQLLSAAHNTEKMGTWKMGQWKLRILRLSLMPVLNFVSPSGPVLCVALPELWPRTPWMSSGLAWWTREEELCTREHWTVYCRSATLQPEKINIADLFTPCLHFRNTPLIFHTSWGHLAFCCLNWPVFVSWSSNNLN